MGAPFGNKYAAFNNGGQPPKYKNKEELIKAIESYFDLFEKGGKHYDEKLKPTITGLSLHLGFMDRSSLYNYKANKEYSHIIKTATTIVENSYEHRLNGPHTSGIIFALKNMKWSDRTEVTTIDKKPEKVEFDDFDEDGEG